MIEGYRVLKLVGHGAAGVADDLRRYLNDESIQAKPPNTAIKTAKWVRRNPWKTVGSSLAALLVIAGLLLLARWELYMRLHTEYAARVDWADGFLEPLERISLSKASHMPSYVRLTRRGRF